MFTCKQMQLSEDGKILIRAPWDPQDFYSIPDSIETIGEFAFLGGRQYLGDPGVLDFNDNFPRVTVIKYGAFKDCTELRHVTFSSNIESIEEAAFTGCTKLLKLTIPSNIVSISDRVFSHCTSLRTVDLPPNIVSIGYDAFQGCSNLHVLVPPCSVHPEAFLNCKLVINASGHHIDGSLTVSTKFIKIRNRLLNLWSSVLRRQGRLRQTSRSYENMNAFVDAQAAEERIIVLQLWSEVKSMINQAFSKRRALAFLFSKIVREGKKLVNMKSYIQQPENTKVFKSVLLELGVRPIPRLRFNWEY